MSVNSVCVLIPAYNEEATIAAVVRRVLKIPSVSTCVVMDDGSTDKTASLARHAGAKVISYPKNRGRDIAIRIGLRFAVKRGFERVVLLDADGQHNPADILKLLKQLANYDVAIGSRFQGSGSTQISTVRSIGSFLIRTALKLAYGRTVRDPTSGFRAYTKRVVELLARDYPIGFSEPETIMRFLREGIRFVEIPVSMQPRITGSSYMTFFKSISLIFFLLFKILKDVSLHGLKPVVSLECPRRNPAPKAQRDYSSPD